MPGQTTENGSYDERQRVRGDWKGMGEFGLEREPQQRRESNHTYRDDIGQNDIRPKPTNALENLTTVESASEPHGRSP